MEAFDNLNEQHEHVVSSVKALLASLKSGEVSIEDVRVSEDGWEIVPKEAHGGGNDHP